MSQMDVRALAWLIVRADKRGDLEELEGLLYALYVMHRVPRSLVGVKAA